MAGTAFNVERNMVVICGLKWLALTFSAIFNFNVVFVPFLNFFLYFCTFKSVKWKIDLDKCKYRMSED